MSFIINLFSSKSSTTTTNNTIPTEKANKLALEALIKERNLSLKAECRQFEQTYKQAIQEAELDYRFAVEQAKADMFRDIFIAIQRDVDMVLASNEYKNADAKTRSKIDCFRAWMVNSATNNRPSTDETLDRRFFVQ
ncbi:hypothetical protein BG004_007105 [Podila humilis]|nr:hypothetical protein BG004_007105 [Podila humilis]